MGFSYAGSISGAAPIIEKIMIGETCYVGQILMQSGMTAELTVQDVANEAHENDLWVYGLVTGVYDTTPSFSGTTGYGDTATYHLPGRSDCPRSGWTSVCGDHQDHTVGYAHHRQYLRWYIWESINGGNSNYRRCRR